MSFSSVFSKKSAKHPCKKVFDPYLPSAVMELYCGKRKISLRSLLLYHLTVSLVLILSTNAQPMQFKCLCNLQQFKLVRIRIKPKFYYLLLGRIQRRPEAFLGQVNGLGTPRHYHKRLCYSCWDNYRGLR